MGCTIYYINYLLQKMNEIKYTVCYVLRHKKINLNAYQQVQFKNSKKLSNPALLVLNTQDSTTHGIQVFG